MLAIGARGHTITAILGGIVTALGATTMLVIYSALPIGEATPLVILLAGLILGIAVGLLGRRGGGQESSPMMPPTNAPPPASAPPPA
jgi:VIT1/CCC1 family predicted Fe2+/Mn2+ transporter